MPDKSEHPSNINHHFGASIYAKEIRIVAGDVLVQHKHKFDHLSILAQGTVQVTVDGVTREMTGPTCLTIAANKHHGIVAVTDAVWYCIHATTETDPLTIDEVLIEPFDKNAVEFASVASKQASGGSFDDELVLHLFSQTLQRK